MSLNTCTQGSVTPQLGSAAQPGCVAHYGLVTNSIWGDQDTRRMQKPHATTGVATVHTQKPMPIPPDPLQLLSSGNFASRLQQRAWYKLADSSFWQKK